MVRFSLVVACAGALCACGTAAPQVARYTGPAPACASGGGTTATLARSGGDIAFAPTDGALVVHGILGPSGSFAGSLALRGGTPGKADVGAAPGAGKSNGNVAIIAVAGMLTAEQATLTYTAPGCQDHLTLARVHPALL